MYFKLKSGCHTLFRTSLLLTMLTIGANLASGQERPRAGEPQPNSMGWVRAVACSADGKRAFVGDAGGSILVWDLEQRTLVRRIALPVGSWKMAPCFAFSPEGRLAITGRRDGETLSLWDMTNGMRIRAFATKEPVGSVALSPDGKLALSVSLHKWVHENLNRPPIPYMAIRLWDTANGALVRTLLEECPFGYVPVAFSPDGKLAAAGGGGDGFRW